MEDNKTKKISKIWIVISISIAILFLLTVGGIILISSTAVPIPSGKDVWIDENRIILVEAHSDDSLHKYAEYYYDSGVLGYTAVQKSYVKFLDKYPIKGNVGRESGSTEYNVIKQMPLIVIKGCEGDVIDTLKVIYEKQDY